MHNPFSKRSDKPPKESNWAVKVFSYLLDLLFVRFKKNQTIVSPSTKRDHLRRKNKPAHDTFFSEGDDIVPVQGLWDEKLYKKIGFSPSLKEELYAFHHKHDFKKVVYVKAAQDPYTLDKDPVQYLWQLRKPYNERVSITKKKMSHKFKRRRKGRFI